MMGIEKALRDRFAKNGPMPFSVFMETALYHPKHGYYCRQNPIGRGGDFTTAPVTSSLFAYPIAVQVQKILSALSGSTMLLEIGPGGGHLASSLLVHLDQLEALPDVYGLFDVSPTLRESQKAHLQQTLPKHLFDRCQWFDDWPDAFLGVVLANEVLDAMPVEQIQLTHDGFEQRFVAWLEDRWQWVNGPCVDPVLKRAVAKVQPWLSHCPEGYITEINAGLPAWFASLDRAFEQGGMLWLDYGYHAAEYYRSDRSMGSLMAYEDHKAWDDVLVHPGRRDITAHVDFTFFATLATEMGYSIGGWATQSNFLINADIAKVLQMAQQQEQWNEVQAVKELLMPGEMGEMFKVLGLAKGVEIDWVGFARRNQWRRLAQEALV